MELGSHSEVGDEGPFGDLDVEANALGFGSRIDDGALDGGVGKAGRDPALHLVALDGDVISTDGLWAVDRVRGRESNSPVLTNP